MFLWSIALQYLIYTICILLIDVLYVFMVHSVAIFDLHNLYLID